MLSISIRKLVGRNHISLLLFLKGATTFSESISCFQLVDLKLTQAKVTPSHDVKAGVTHLPPPPATPAKNKQRTAIKVTLGLHKTFTKNCFTT